MTKYSLLLCTSAASLSLLRVRSHKANACRPAQGAGGAPAAQDMAPSGGDAPTGGDMPSTREPGASGGALERGGPSA